MHVHIDSLSDCAWTSLYARKMACDGTDMGSGPAGLSKPPSREFRYKYLSNPYTISK